jgi:uncharacterized membrane protein YqjE
MISADTELRDRSTAELVKQLSQQAGVLVRQEIELGKIELREKAADAGVAIGAFAAAAVAGLLALGALTAFLILALDGVMPAWAAAVCVTAMWAVVAAVLALVGRQRLREMETPVPEKTLETLKEDVQWLKHPTK